MDTVIIGNQRYDMPESDLDVVVRTKELLVSVKSIMPTINTDEQYNTVSEILEQIDELVQYIP